jgi:hypothetical protein
MLTQNVTTVTLIPYHTKNHFWCTQLLASLLFWYRLRNFTLDEIIIFIHSQVLDEKLPSKSSIKKAYRGDDVNGGLVELLPLPSER